MEDFITWVDSSKIKRNIMKYRDEVDDFDLLWAATFVSFFICNFCGNYFFKLGRAAEMIGSEGEKKLGLSVSYPWSSAWKEKKKGREEEEFEEN